MYLLIRLLRKRFFGLYRIHLLVDMIPDSLQARQVFVDRDRVGLPLEDGLLVVDVLEKAAIGNFEDQNSAKPKSLPSFCESKRSKK